MSAEMESRLRNLENRVRTLEEQLRNLHQQISNMSANSNHDLNEIIKALKTLPELVKKIHEAKSANDLLNAVSNYSARLYQLK